MKKEQNVSTLLNEVAETVSVGDRTLLESDTVLNLARGEKIKRKAVDGLPVSERGELVVEF